jgi:hypothetical protein
MLKPSGLPPGLTFKNSAFRLRNGLATKHKEAAGETAILTEVDGINASSKQETN